MKCKITIKDFEVEVDLSQPIDISIPLQPTAENPLAWHQDQPVVKPVVMGDWVGKVSEGGSVNFNNVFFNPHAHGTHTESYGHISKEFFSVRSEERRVGKECRSRCAPDHYKKKVIESGFSHG